MSDCLFCNIIDKTIPADIVFEDEHMLVFKDIHPKAPVHLLAIPKVHVTNLDDLNTQHAQMIAHMLLTFKTVAQAAGLDTGYRVITNNGEGGGQEVYHLHFHILGGSTALPGF